MKEISLHHWLSSSQVEPAGAVAAAAVGGVAAEVGAVVAAVPAEALPAADALVGPVGAVAHAVAQADDVHALPVPLGVALQGGILASRVLRTRLIKTVLLILERKIYEVRFRFKLMLLLLAL